MNALQALTIPHALGAGGESGAALCCCCRCRFRPPSAMNGSKYEHTQNISMQRILQVRCKWLYAVVHTSCNTCLRWLTGLRLISSTCLNLVQQRIYQAVGSLVYCTMQPLLVPKLHIPFQSTLVKHVLNCCHLLLHRLPAGLPHAAVHPARHAAAGSSRRQRGRCSSAHASAASRDQRCAAQRGVAAIHCGLAAAAERGQRANRQHDSGKHRPSGGYSATLLDWNSWCALRWFVGHSYHMLVCLALAAGSCSPTAAAADTAGASRSDSHCLVLPATQLHIAA